MCSCSKAAARVRWRRSSRRTAAVRSKHRRCARCLSKRIPRRSTFADALVRREFDLVVLLTGVGTRALLQLVEQVRGTREQFVEALAETRIAARGPKPVAVLRELKITPWLIAPEPNTWRELLARTGCEGRRAVACRSSRGCAGIRCVQSGASGRADRTGRRSSPACRSISGHCPRTCSRCGRRSRRSCVATSMSCFLRQRHK